MSSDLSAFWGDWQHSSDNTEPASYHAIRVYLFHCGECGVNLPEGAYWPKYCSSRDKHINLKHETPCHLTFHCGHPHCGINLPEGDFPMKCSRGHLNIR